MSAAEPITIAQDSVSEPAAAPVEKTATPASLETSSTSDAPAQAPMPKTARFWLIILGLLVATFLAAIDLTGLATALPTIALALNSEDYAWIGNSYSITSTIIVPWSGGLADTFGRRPVLLTGLVTFAIGSAMCGAADTMNVMLAGRSFQGIGAGFILSLVEIILADLVPLAERGAYQGAFGAVWALASATGPLIGGGFAATNYRWFFYMNLPLSAIIFAVVAAFMDLPTPKGSLRSKLARMDWTGNFIFIPAITLLIVGLLSGGQQYAWSSANVLAPLIIGIVGLGAWYVFERYFAEHPTVPFKLLSNNTSTIGYATTFLHGIVALALFYFWPVYFQAVQGASPIASAVDFFSVAFIVAPFAMVAGGTIGALQIYKPQNVIAWVFITIGSGLLSLVNAYSSKAAQVGLPILLAVGVGLLYSATVFVVLAPLPASLAGRALAFLVFVRNFGNIIGITVGSVVLAQELGARLPADYLATIPGGVAGAYSAIPTIKDLPQPLQAQVVEAFAQSIRTIWLVLIPFGAIGLFTAVWMKTYKLADVTDASWGLEHPGQSSSTDTEEKATVVKDGSA